MESIDSDTVSVISSTDEAIRVFNSARKFTFFSERTSLLQSENIYNMHEKESLASLIKENSFWLDISWPTSTEMKTVAEIFEIHPLTIEDVMDGDGREKCELFDNYLFICLKTCDVDTISADIQTNSKSNNSVTHLNSGNYAMSLFILLFKDFVITIHSRPVQHLCNVFRRLKPFKNIYKITGDWYFYCIFNTITHEITSNVRFIEAEVDSIHDVVLYFKQNDQTEMLRRIGRARNYVNFHLRLLKPKLEIIGYVTKRNSESFQEHTLFYLRDIQDNLTSMVMNLDQSSETLNRAHNNYLAQISIELAEMSNRMNLQVKKLTQITSLALPFAVVAGLWGMNVIVPFELVNGSMATPDMLYPFWFLVFSSIALSLAFWYLGRLMRFF